MLLTTTNAIEGKEITLYIGIASGEMFIDSLFRCSKKAFKQAIRALYKQKIINIETEGIRLINKDNNIQ